MTYVKAILNADQLVESIRSGKNAEQVPGKGLVQKPFDLKLPDSTPTDLLFGQEYTALDDLEARIQAAKEEEYTGPGTVDEFGRIPHPKRSPESWKSAPLMAPITKEITDPEIRAIMETIKSKESGGNYTIKNPGKGQTASGAYQYTNSTWQALTKKFGIGTEYRTAKEAPPEIQDLVTAAQITDILEKTGGDVTKVPVVWYTGNTAGKISQEAMAVNRGMTPAEYQYQWMQRYKQITKGK